MVKNILNSILLFLIRRRIMIPRLGMMVELRKNKK
jgi:hypothetical protein